MSNLTFEEKIHLIERNLQEITDSDKIILRKIVEKRPLKIYWGTAITGRPHIAYFLPIMKLVDFLSAGCEVTVLFADIHGFLDNLKAPIEKVNFRYEYYVKLIEAIIKCTLKDQLNFDSNDIISQFNDLNINENNNLDLKITGKLKFVKGSDYQKSSDYVFDLYKLSSFTTERDVKRAGADVVKQSDNCCLSSLIYPNMQALDEEYLKVDAQFGGEDQRKIFMHAKTFLPKIGYKKRIHLMNPMMPGLNSDKMSSSDELSKIDLLDTKKMISKKINKCFCEEGNPKTGVLTMFKYIIYPYYFLKENIKNVYPFECSKYEDLELKFINKEIHPGDLKASASNYLDLMISPIRERMNEFPEIIKKAYN